MPQKLRCPQCRNYCQAELAADAQVVTCPHCGQKLRVPAAAPPSTSARVAPGPAAAPAPTTAAEDEIPEVAPLRPGGRPLDDSRRESSARRRDPRDYDDDLSPRRRAPARGVLPPGDPLASVHFGLGFFWWKNLLLIIAMLASFLPSGFSELAGRGPLFAILVLLVVGVGGLCSVAALVFGAIGGVACNRLPHELRDARRFSSPLRTLEIVFPIILLLTAFFFMLIAMLTRRRVGQPPVTGYEFLGIGFLAFAVLAFACWLATYVLLMLFLRSLARHYDDEDTAAKSMWVMVAFLIAALVGPVVIFFAALISRMLGLGIVSAFITIAAVSVVVTVIWAWILFKILQRITAVRRHIVGAARTSAYAPARE